MVGIDRGHVDDGSVWTFKLERLVVRDIDLHRAVPQDKREEMVPFESSATRGKKDFVGRTIWSATDTRLLLAPLCLAVRATAGRLTKLANRYAGLQDAAPLPLAPAASSVYRTRSGASIQFKTSSRVIGWR